MSKGPIVNNGTYFSQDCYVMILIWNQEGKYEGQYQDNMMDDEPSLVFIEPDPSVKCLVPDLTPHQMINALTYQREEDFE